VHFSLRADISFTKRDPLLSHHLFTPGLPL
jgi:hypothetical protein